MNKLLNIDLAFFLNPKKGLPTLILWGIALFFIIAFWNRVIPPEQFEGKESWWTVFKDNYVWFVLIIYGVLIWGVLEATSLLINVVTENEIAEERKEKFKSHSNTFDANPIDIDQVRVITQGDSGLRSINLYNTIIEAGENQRFESPLFAVQRYTDDFIEDTSQLGNIQRLALQLGILGTFLGLIKAFAELYGKATKDLDVTVIIEALSFAFGTSVAGLECAIFLGVFTSVILKNKHKELFDNLNNSANYLVFLCHKAQLFKGTAFDISKLATSVSNQNTELSTQNQLLNEQNDLVRKGLDNLIRSKKELDDFVQKMANDLTTIYNQISPEAFSNEVSKNLSIATQHIVSKLDGHFDNVTQSYKNLGDLDGIIQKMNVKLSENLQVNNELVSKSKTEIFGTLEAITKQLQTASGSDIREELLKNITIVGEQLTLNNTNEMQLIRGELGLLQNQLSSFNKTFSTDVENKKPVKLLLEMGGLSIQFVKSVVLGTIELIKDLFKQIFK